MRVGGGGRKWGESPGSGLRDCLLELGHRALEPPVLEVHPRPQARGGKGDEALEKEALWRQTGRQAHTQMSE